MSDGPVNLNRVRKQKARAAAKLVVVLIDAASAEAKSSADMPGVKNTGVKLGSASVPSESNSYTKNWPAVCKIS